MSTTGKQLRVTWATLDLCGYCGLALRTFCVRAQVDWIYALQLDQSRSRTLARATFAREHRRVFHGPTRRLESRLLRADPKHPHLLKVGLRFCFHMCLSPSHKTAGAIISWIPNILHVGFSNASHIHENYQGLPYRMKAAMLYGTCRVVQSAEERLYNREMNK